MSWEQSSPLTKYLADVYMSKHKSLLPSHVSQLLLESAHFVRAMQNALNATCEVRDALDFGGHVGRRRRRALVDSGLQK